MLIFLTLYRTITSIETIVNIERAYQVLIKYSSSLCNHSIDRLPLYYSVTKSETIISIMKSAGINKLKKIISFE